MKNSPLKIGIGGLGAIGLDLATALAAGCEGLALAAVSARDSARARTRVDALGPAAAGVEVMPLAALAEHCDVVVECAPAAVFDEVATPAVEAGRIFVPVSAGALLSRASLVERARETGARIVVPTGALLGLDAVRAAAIGGLREVRMVTRKPPAGLAGAPHLVDNGIDVSNLDAPLKVFEGSAREGAIGFPANVNVAAALALAGIGPDRTRLEVWADPAVTRNHHRIVVDSEVARFELAIENVPSEANPRSGRIVAPSVLATLQRLVAPLTVGT